MANPLLYTTPDTFDYFPSEEFFPWLGPGFQSFDSFIYEAGLVQVPSLEEIIACWGPALVQPELSVPLADAYGSGPPVEPVTAYFNQSTDPDSSPFKPTDIRLAGPMGYPMPDIGCSTLNSFYPLNPVSNLS